MTTSSKHQKLYDWLVEQPIGCETHHAKMTTLNNQCAVDALRELTSMIMCSSNQDINAFIDQARAGIRSKAEAENIDLPIYEQDILCTD